MTQKIPKSREHKLKLPLQFTIGSDGIVYDGVFTLTRKDVSKVIIKSTDSDGYANCELLEPEHEKPTSPQIMKMEPILIGTDTSRHRGRGKEIGQYKYFEIPNGELIAEISGRRKRRIHLGSLTEHSSEISTIAHTIFQKFPNEEFDRKQLIRFLPKNLSYGQILKSALDILTIKLYLEKRKTLKMGRPYDRFKATSNLHQYAIRPSELIRKLIGSSSEQAQNG